MNQLLLRTKQNKNLDPSTQEPTTMTKRVCFLLSCVFCFAAVLLSKTVRVLKPLFNLLWSVCFMEAIMCLSVLFCTFLLKVFCLLLFSLLGSVVENIKHYTLLFLKVTQCITFLLSEESNLLHYSLRHDCFTH